METLVIIAHHRNHKSRIFNGDFSSSRGFKGISCRTESLSAILPSPRVLNCSPEPKSPLGPPVRSSRPRSNLIAISPKPDIKEHSLDEEEFSYSELWAGPAYTNSPPPSSLPIPKFSLRQKRSVSLELPSPSSGVVLPPLAKSAPTSPTRDTYSSATESLRRILQLDVADD
ncbi:uncharacterized protein M6B38_254825 [Iris pallida]|uniref:Uncharacterized protein n=1 Tax=Iris pallida TaxID=29817 RepID=A0AAX6IHI6_IRIPA|nr:uncharacterized protein M6B38_254825 [Iris pallida]